MILFVISENNDNLYNKISVIFPLLYELLPLASHTRTTTPNKQNQTKSHQYKTELDFHERQQGTINEGKDKESFCHMD